MPLLLVIGFDFVCGVHDCNRPWWINMVMKIAVCCSTLYPCLVELASTKTWFGCLSSAHISEKETHG